VLVQQVRARACADGRLPDFIHALHRSRGGFRRRRLRGDPHLFLRDDLSIAPGGAARSRAGAPLRMTPFVSARGIVKSYPVGGTVLTILRELDLDVFPGEMVAIIGASGVGKSTLLHVLGGLDQPDLGQVTIGAAN